MVNSPRGRGARADGAYIRRAANVHRIPCLTTAAAATGGRREHASTARSTTCGCARCRSTTGAGRDVDSPTGGR